MKSPRILLGLVLSNALLLPTMVRAQALLPGSLAMVHISREDASATSLPTAEFTVRREVAEASVEFTAADHYGRALDSLSLADLRVLDGDQTVTDFKSFELVRRQPMHLAILVDSSDSIDRKQRDIPARVLAAMATAFDSRRDNAFLVAFSAKSEVLQRPTSDFATIQNAAQQHRKPGLTSLFDTILKTCEETVRSSGAGGRRVLLLFSDGLDTLSIHTIDDAINAAHRAGVVIYAVSEGYAPEGLQNLSRLSMATGGKSFVVHKEREILSVLAELNGLAQDRYIVTFRPATTVAGFHPVRVSLPDRHDVQIHSASGYYLASGSAN